ncbi:helix-turn-helix transcriptional regulator [Nocardia amamiensis]|uniref:Helix-turn-helix transcriptional regulator n=1 Tax=Nocardia amamiensis TaxID=404578 RepID=A0ABS0D5R7_9NOCA|nr:helix-turn-helix transcriptional regulator [Nocardia amamiensis]MBF6302488.1 helix-turn-helix transcriptional regulator [Nocardia amamiensis]
MTGDRGVGELLREWRHRRKLSQLDLAIQADVSARHVSFVETGRTTPSRSMVLHLAEQMNVPLRERNRLLIAAGYAPEFHGRDWTAPALRRARDAVQRVLHLHEPYPALAVDRHWNLVQANDCVQVFFDDVDPGLLEPPINMMRLGLHPRGFASRLRNLEQVRGFLLPRLARQVMATGDPELTALHEELRCYGVPGSADIEPGAIMLPIRLCHRDAELSFFSTVTTFGAVFDITLDEVAVEAYFPADDKTEAYLRELAAVPMSTRGRGGGVQFTTVASNQTAAEPPGRSRADLVNRPLASMAPRSRGRAVGRR